MNFRNAIIACMSAGALVVPAAAGATHPARPDGSTTYLHLVRGTVVMVGTDPTGADPSAADDVVVHVLSGNYRAHQLVGQDVTFDLGRAVLRVRDRNADGVANLADVQVGDRVMVKFRLPRDPSVVARLTARRFEVKEPARPTHPSSHGHSA